MEEEVRKNLELIGRGRGCGRDLLNKITRAQFLRSRPDKWDFMKLKSFCKAKDTVKKTKGVRGQPGIQSEFQDNQGYTEKQCLY